MSGLRLSVCLIPVVLAPATAAASHGTAQSPSLEFELAVAGQIGGPTYALGVWDQFAYMGSGRTLLAVDIGDSGAPSPGTSIALPDTPVHLTTDNSTAYLALGEPGLGIVDLSEPNNPRLVSTTSIGLGARRVAASGDRAFVADVENLLYEFDVGQPDAPSLVVTTELPVFADDMEISGDLLLVTCTIKGRSAAKRLYVFNIGQPDWTASVGFVDLNSTASEAMYVAGSGTTAFVASSSRLHTIDVSDAASPVELSRVGLPSGDEPVDPYPGIASDVGVVGDYVYMAGTIGAFVSLGRVWVFDVSTPSNPEYLRRIETIDEDLPAPPRLAIGTDLAVTAAYSYLAVLDTSEPSQPTVSGACEGVRDANGVVVRSGDYLYMGALRTLRVLSLAQPHLPRQVAALALPTTIVRARVGAIRFVADTAYVVLTGALESQLYIVDAGDPLTPRLLGQTGILEGSAYHLTVTRGHAYISLGIESPSALSTLRILDVGIANNPREVASFDGGGALELDGELGVIPFGDELRTVDLSDPAAPRKIGGLLIPDLDVHLLVEGGTAFARSRARDKMPLRVVDVSNPTALHEIGGNNDESVPRVFHEKYVLSGGCLRGVRVVDVSDPTAPYLAAHSDWPSCLYGIAAQGPYLYVAGWLDSLAVLELREPVEPTPEPTPTATATKSTEPNGTPTPKPTSPGGGWQVFLPVAYAQR